MVNSEGRLIGMLGKELRDSGTGVWLNYALPIDALRVAIGDIIAGRAATTPKDDKPILSRQRSHNPTTLGLVLVPDVLETTPVYVDAVQAKHLVHMSLFGYAAKKLAVEGRLYLRDEVALKEAGR